MRPVDIPDSRRWANSDGRPVERRTLGAPRGAEDQVRPIEALVEQDQDGLGLQYHVLVQLQDGDLGRLAADPHYWLTFWGGVVPFALTLPEGEGSRLVGYRTMVDGRERFLGVEDVQLIYDNP